MIHRYQKKGLNFVLDVNSGAVHLLDDISYAVSGLLDENMGDTCPQGIIDALPDYTADEIREAYDELYELKKAGQLVAQDDYIDVSRYIPVNAPVKALCLHVAHDCNLRCKYCFASTGDFGQGRKIMPPEIAKKAIDFVIARSGVRHNIEVDFFGGEPLMAWDTVTQTVDYARSLEKKYNKKFRFTITTNGLLLDEDKRKYINENMDNCVLSLDGRREVTAVDAVLQREGSGDLAGDAAHVEEVVVGHRGAGHVTRVYTVFDQGRRRHLFGNADQTADRCRRRRDVGLVAAVGHPERITQACVRSDAAYDTARAAIFRAVGVVEHDLALVDAIVEYAVAGGQDTAQRVELVPGIGEGDGEGAFVGAVAERPVRFLGMAEQSSVLAGVDGAREVEAEIAFVRAVHERSFRFVRGACDDAADELRPGCPRDDEFAGIVAIGVDRTDVRQADQSAEITCRGNGFRPGEGQCGLVGDFRQCRTVVIDGQRAGDYGGGLRYGHAARQREVLYLGRCVERVKQAEFLRILIRQLDGDRIVQTVESPFERIGGRAYEAGLGKGAQIDVADKDDPAAVGVGVERRPFGHRVAEGYELFGG